MLIWSLNFNFFPQLFHEFLPWIFLPQIWKKGMLSFFRALNVHLENMNHICCKQFTCSCLNYAKLINIICKIYKKKERKKNKERFIREICTFLKLYYCTDTLYHRYLKKCSKKYINIFGLYCFSLKTLTKILDYTYIYVIKINPFRTFG